MPGIEQIPLISSPFKEKKSDANISKTDSEILEEHSKTAWPPEYLFEQELSAEFHRHYELYLNGEFWEITDRSDFDTFCRMMRSLKAEKIKLEKKYLPERVRVEESEEAETSRFRKIYEEMNMENQIGFSFRKLFLGCFGLGGQENTDRVLFEF